MKVGDVMKYIIYSLSCFLFFTSQVSLADNLPIEYITFYNASDSDVTAQVSPFAKFTLGSNERRNVAYSTLRQACSANPSYCIARFYVNNASVGSATINSITGKLVNMNLALKVNVSKTKNMVSGVTILST